MEFTESEVPGVIRYVLSIFWSWGVMIQCSSHNPISMLRMTWLVAQAELGLYRVSNSSA
jgi:hypothetical protein